MDEREPRGPVVLEGIAGSPGLAVGRAVVVDTGRAGVRRAHVEGAGVEGEVARFDAAVAGAAKALREVAAKVPSGRAESSILEAYILMVEDETLRDEVDTQVRAELKCSEWAVESAVGRMAQQLGASLDPYLAERSHDIEFVGDRILMALAGQPRTPTFPDLEEPAIIVGYDLSPAETASLSRQSVGALVTEVGTRTNHTSILARALEIPAVVGVRGLMGQIGEGDRLIVDGYRGRIIVGPDQRTVAETLARVERQKKLARAMLVERDRPAKSRCGLSIELMANIELPSEAAAAIEHGAQGIGLYRTEFLFVDRSEPPSEDEQYSVYRRVIETVAPRPVTLRTFDIGGDKFGSTFQVPTDMNPALGLRAVRLGLARPELFLSQLRAMLRASAHGPVQIMVPMIASVSELRAVRELLDRAAVDVDRAGHARGKRVPLGVMVEVPSAVIMANELAREADFFSIGTNDLVQYALAVDRGSPDLAYLATPLDPAILRLIRSVVQAGDAQRRAVSVCGAMASDPVASVLLMGLGVRSLSLTSAAIPAVKVAIGRFSCAEAQSVAEGALAMATAREVEEWVDGRLTARLSDLVDQD